MHRKDTQPGEPVNALLRLLHVRSSVWCRSAMRAPWGFAIRERPIAAFHLIVEGRCELEVERAGTFSLEAGDLVVVPNGAAHVARSDGTAKVQFLDDILDLHPPSDGRLAYGGGGPLADIVCGGFEVSDPVAEPTLRRLPPVLIAKGSAGLPRADLRAALDMLLTELRQARTGTDAVVTRLSDVVLALVIRGALEADISTAKSWSDPAIAPTVTAMSERPAEQWTVADLANIAHLSRSVFAERFRAVTGEPPMHYLTRVRVSRAAALLRQDGDTLETIAQATGFASGASLSRAFHRALGVSPSGYRAAPRLAEAGSSEPDLTTAK